MGDEYTSSYEIFDRPLGAGQNRQPRLDAGGGNPNMFAGFGTDLYNTFANPLGILSLLSTGLGVGTGVLNQNQANADYRALLKQAQTPFNSDQYYVPISDAQRAAMERALKANLALRGVPLDSMIASGAVSELMGRNELDRRRMAYELASRQQQNILGAMSGRQPRPAMGDVSALGNYLSMLKLMQTRQSETANQASQWERLMTILGGNKSAAENTLYNNYNYATPAVYGDFQGDVPGYTEDYTTDYTNTEY